MCLWFVFPLSWLSYWSTLTSGIIYTMVKDIAPFALKIRVMRGLGFLNVWWKMYLMLVVAGCFRHYCLVFMQTFQGYFIWQFKYYFTSRVKCLGENAPVFLYRQKMCIKSKHFLSTLCSWFLITMKHLGNSSTTLFIDMMVIGSPICIENYKTGIDVCCFVGVFVCLFVCLHRCW